MKIKKNMPTAIINNAVNGRVKIMLATDTVIKSEALMHIDTGLTIRPNKGVNVLIMCKDDSSFYNIIPSAFEGEAARPLIVNLLNSTSRQTMLKAGTHIADLIGFSSKISKVTEVEELELDEEEPIEVEDEDDNEDD